MLNLETNTHRSTHLRDIANAPEAFREKLEKIRLGARLGRLDMPISDEAVAHLARACPNLKNLHLDGAVLITGTCIPSVLTSCPDLTSLSITGHDRRLGSLDLDHLTPLAEDPVISVSAPKLKNLDLRRAIISPAEKYREVLKAVTRPVGRKNKLEVHFTHPTAHWEKTFKNGKEKQQRTPGGRENFEAMQDLLAMRLDAKREDDEYSETKSELSVLIHSMD